MRSISIALVVLLASICPMPGHAAKSRIGGTGAGLAITRLLANAYAKDHPDFSFDVLPSLGSSGGIKAVAAGAIQLAVSARDLMDAERRQGLEAQELARTPFVFAVSPDNALEGTTLAQLIDLYSGKATRWPDGGKVRIVLRPVTDSDSAMIRSISPEMERAKVMAENRPGMLFAVTDQDTQDSLERIPGALGATSLGQMLAEQRRLKALALDGVRPSAENIANGRYPFEKTLYLITSPSTPADTQDFVKFAGSASGREILARYGYWAR